MVNGFTKSISFEIEINKSCFTFAYFTLSGKNQEREVNV